MAQRLSSKHHALMQALLSRGPMREDEFHALFAGVTGRNPAIHHQLFDGFVLMINKELAYLNFELRGCRNQYDGRVVYGVVNNAADDQSKLGTKYSVPQIAFYKAVAEMIIQDATSQGFITNIEALNIRLDNQIYTGQGSQGSQSRIPAAFKNFSMSKKEKTLSDLIEDQWLCCTPNGNIGLGVRSFLDLRRWFYSANVPSCDVCNEAGVKAYTCPKEGCSVRIHEYCLEKKFPHQKIARVCPRCSTPWPVEEIEEESRFPLDNSTPQKRARRSKAQAAPSNVSAMRKRNRDSAFGQSSITSNKEQRCKAEAVDLTQAHNDYDAPWGRVPTKMRSCNAEGDADRDRPVRTLLFSEVL